MVAELVGADEVNLVIPAARGDARRGLVLARFKREVVAEMAEIAARLHAARSFHKDLLSLPPISSIPRSRRAIG